MRPAAAKAATLALAAAIAACAAVPAHAALLGNSSLSDGTNPAGGTLTTAPGLLDTYGPGSTPQSVGLELIYGPEGGAGRPYFAYNTTDDAGSRGTFSALLVPEPASTGLIAAALVSLALVRRRKG